MKPEGIEPVNECAEDTALGGNSRQPLPVPATWPSESTQHGMAAVRFPVADPRKELARDFTVGELPIPNRLCVHPMEGCDADKHGNPTELTLRRYRRFASGGAGLIWAEACAVDASGRGNPHQILINDRTADGLRKIVETVQTKGVGSGGEAQRPAIIVQLSHAGRYRKPEGKPEPAIVHHSAVLDQPLGLSVDAPLLSDGELEAIGERYVQAASVAASCGFDGVDIKACHGYLLHELLYAHRRERSRYGGSFDCRTRLLREIISEVRRTCPNLAVAVRLSVYDGIPYPWGWGTDLRGSPALEEPAALIRALAQEGVELVSVAVGNPYYNPHLERPYDRPIRGGYEPTETPLESVLRMLELTAEIHRRVPEMPLVATGLSWLRHLVPTVAAGMVAEGWVSSVGLGRMAIAHPGFANDILAGGQVAHQKQCIACSACIQLMRDGGRSGCVVRDAEIYAEEYRRVRRSA